MLGMAMLTAVMSRLTIRWATSRMARSHGPRLCGAGWLVWLVFGWWCMVASGVVVDGMPGSLSSLRSETSVIHP